MEARTCAMSAAATLCLALAVYGCGGGGSDGGPAPGPSPGPGPAPGGGSAIRIVGENGSQSFDPNPAPAPSTGVAWRNDDNVVHRIVANDGSFDTGNIAPGATSAMQRLATDGTNYHCSLHPTMIGAINSSGGTAPPCTGLYCDD
jgi:plastocyanin